MKLLSQTLKPTLQALLLATPLALYSAPTAALTLGLDGAALVQGEENVASLIAQGRLELEAGRAAEAEVLFTRAHELSGEAFETQLWILRSWMEQARSNDTLDALDALAKAGREGAEMDYLYGMAFARRAEQAMMAGNGDVSARMNFDDAVRFLQAATEADPVRFRDAFLPLANAAWFSQDLPTARAAADAAVQRYPQDGEANLTRGRIALSQFQVALGAAEGPTPDTWTGDVLEHWTLARNSFADAMTNFGKPERSDTRRQNLLSQAAVQLAHAWIWKQGKDEAAEAFGTAIAWAPDRVDMGEVRNFLADPENPNDVKLFRHALERGAKTFDANLGAQDPRNAALQWWLGYARYWGHDREASEKAFLACLEQEPSYVNAWVYVGLCRYDRKAYDEAIEAFQAGWDADPVTIIREVQGDLTANANRLRFLIGHAFEAGSLERAAFVAELVAESTQTVSGDWNNLGLFLRDEGERRQRNRKAKTEEELAAIQDLHERAYVAYQRSLELAPEDPQVLNDTAVMLHYYLDRDLEHARAMYEKAGELVDAELAKKGLSKADRERFEIAKRDAGNNLRMLLQLLEKRKKPVVGGAESGA